jgi:hypothetical protein
MTRPRTSRARWDARRQALILPLPERIVIRAAAQLGRSGALGIEALGTWLRRFVCVAAALPRGRPRGDLRTPSGRLMTRATWEAAAEMKRQSLKSSNKIK